MAKTRKTSEATQSASEAKTAPARRKATAAKVAGGRTVAAAKKVSPAKSAKPGRIEKLYLKDGRCNVTFMLPKAAAPDAASVCILGEFNNWSADANPLARLTEGDFAVTLLLDAGRSYRFRYVIDGWKFENDWFADRYEPNPYGGEDSVVDV